MAIRIRDLMRVADQPEVRAAIEARDQALEAYREMAKAMRDADRLVDHLNAEMEAVAARALLELTERDGHDPAACRDGDHYGQCPGVTQ